MTRRQIISIIIMTLSIGCLTQSCNKEAIPHSNEVSYAKDIAPLMTNYCLTCHSDEAPLANLSLTTYETVRDIAKTGKLITRMTSEISPMPPSGLLSGSDQQKIKVWINGNYQP